MLVASNLAGRSRIEPAKRPEHRTESEDILHAEAFAQLMAEDHPRLVRALTLACGDRDVAEDAVQEAMVRAWDRLDRGEELTSLSGWVAVVALNEARATHRRRGAERRAREKLHRRATDASRGTADSTADAVLRSITHDEDAVALRVAILDLPPRQRDVTVLHYYLHHDIATIAALSGISVGAVKNALFNARAALAKTLGPRSVVEAEAEAEERSHG